MLEYSVGPDELSFDGDLNMEDYVWVIYSYESGSYDGDGLAVALRKDGTVEYCGLGHCSCYGPTESWSSECTKVSLEEFLKFGEYDDTIRDKKRAKTDYDYDRWQSIVNKALEVSDAASK